MLECPIISSLWLNFKYLFVGYSLFDSDDFFENTKYFTYFLPFFPFFYFFFPFYFPIPTVLPLDLKPGIPFILTFLAFNFYLSGDFSFFFMGLLYFLFFKINFWLPFFLFRNLFVLLLSRLSAISQHDKLNLFLFSASLPFKRLVSSSTERLFLGLWLVPLNLLFLKSLTFYRSCIFSIPIVVFFVLIFFVNFFFFKEC